MRGGVESAVLSRCRCELVRPGVELVLVSVKKVLKSGVGICRHSRGRETQAIQGAGAKDRVDAG
jgi:hypothetical protein